MTSNCSSPELINPGLPGESTSTSRIPGQLVSCSDVPSPSLPKNFAPSPPSLNKEAFGVAGNFGMQRQSLPSGMHRQSLPSIVGPIHETFTSHFSKPSGAQEPLSHQPEGVHGASEGTTPELWQQLLKSIEHMLTAQENHIIDSMRSLLMTHYGGESRRGSSLGRASVTSISNTSMLDRFKKNGRRARKSKSGKRSSLASESTKESIRRSLASLSSRRDSYSSALKATDRKSMPTAVIPNQHSRSMSSSISSAMSGYETLKTFTKQRQSIHDAPAPFAVERHSSIPEIPSVSEVTESQTVSIFHPSGETCRRSLDGDTTTFIPDRSANQHFSVETTTFLPERSAKQHSTISTILPVPRLESGTSKLSLNGAQPADDFGHSLSITRTPSFNNAGDMKDRISKMRNEKPSEEVADFNEKKQFQHELKRLQSFQKHLGEGGQLSNLNSTGTDPIDVESNTNCIENILKSRPVELFISFMILANAVVMGMQVDAAIQNTKSGGFVFRIFDVVFMIFFTIELILRIIAHRCFYFSYRNPSVGWNMFDFFLVVFSLLEEFLSHLMTMSSNISVMRVFRILRLVRIFRVVRVMRFFKDLRVIASGIASSLQALVWAMLLLLVFMFLCAVCVLQFAVEEVHTRENHQSTGRLNDDEYADLRTFYASLFTTMLTLYQSITGGLNWRDAARPLMSISVGLGLLYSFYIAFAVLCVLNIITGVFVENANKLNAQDQEMVMMEELEIRRKWLEEVRELFEAADTDGSGCLNAEEFSEQMKDIKMQTWFRRIGIHVESYSGNALFKLLDFDGDGQLDLDEFSIALQQVHGTARSIDVAKIAHDTRLIRRGLDQLSELCFYALEELSPGCVRCVFGNEFEINEAQSDEAEFVDVDDSDEDEADRNSPKNKSQSADQISTGNVIAFR